ncbi:MAG TPA: addiction module protein [Desulfomonilaceae bacterium]|nr:addiction module protein [Desulfomonilaceae bacterium]
MDQNSTSIFDLSSSEKLQPAQHFRDDLPAKPEAIPVNDRQKEKLARRKANLVKNPAAGLTWEEIKERVRSLYGR